jgi:hypothetical protein
MSRGTGYYWSTDYAGQAGFHRLRDVSPFWITHDPYTGLRRNDESSRRNRALGGGSALRRACPASRPPSLAFWPGDGPGRRPASRCAQPDGPDKTLLRPSVDAGGAQAGTPQLSGRVTPSGNAQRGADRAFDSVAFSGGADGLAEDASSKAVDAGSFFWAASRIAGAGAIGSLVNPAGP